MMRIDALDKLVAPHVGAWIETSAFRDDFEKSFVAPHVGAWIETKLSKSMAKGYESHPMWVRGLKLRAGSFAAVGHRVAPHVGAWIETLYPFWYSF